MPFINFRLSVFVDGARRISKTYDPDPDISDSHIKIGQPVELPEVESEHSSNNIIPSLSIKDMFYEAKTYKTRDVRQVTC